MWVIKRNDNNVLDIMAQAKKTQLACAIDMSFKLYTFLLADYRKILQHR